MGGGKLGVKKGKSKRPILITGCARSGTSITAGIIEFCGAFGGDVTGPTPHNKKGQFENKTVRDKIVKPYLRSIGADPLGQHPVPNTNNLKIDIYWQSRLIETMKQQGYRNGDWFYKGAKMCLFWPQWHFAFPKARWVIVRRDDDEIAESCMKTGFMRSYKNKSGWQKWIDHHKQCFQEMKEAGLNTVEVWPSKVVRGDFTEMKEAITHIGLQWKPDVIQDFIDPRLWNTAKRRRRNNG